MRFLFSPFVLLLTLILGLGYFYLARSLDLVFQILLFLPFLSVWLLPVLYWSGRRHDAGNFARAIHIVSYISMGWLSSVVCLMLIKDLAFWILRALQAWSAAADMAVYGAATLLTVCGSLFIRTGPKVKEVEVPIENLPAELDDFRIVQISDLHIGPIIRKAYVEKVVATANSLRPDLVALTGDFVDGSVEDLYPFAELLAALEPKDRVFFIMGNHDYYSGGENWIRSFQKIGLKVLLNSSLSFRWKDRSILVSGVVDPAARMMGAEGPDPAAARGQCHADLKLFLAHNPSIAAKAEHLGFDLQLSGHTHGGQFWPWTWVVKGVHSPHYMGLSREGRMWVYVNAGTGTWGPPLRLGTSPEITLIRLKLPARKL